MHAFRKFSLLFLEKYETRRVQKVSFLLFINVNTSRSMCFNHIECLNLFNYPNNWEMQPVFSFLSASNVMWNPLTEKHGKMQWNGRKWMRQLNEEWSNVHDKAWSGQHFNINEDLVRKVNENIHQDQWFMVSLLSNKFLQISRTVLHKGVKDCLRYQKLS